MSKWDAKVSVKPGRPGAGSKKGQGQGGRGQGGPQGGGGDLRESMQAARELVKAKQFDEAIKAFEDILETNPDAVQAYTGLGNVYAAKGEYENALEYYAGALYIKNDLVPALMMSGVAYLKLDKSDSALEKFHEALKIQPSLEKAHIAIARLYVKKENNAKAIEAVREGLKYNPQSEEARLMLANLLQKEGHEQDALEQLNQAIAHDPQAWKPYLKKAQIFVKRKEYKEVIDASRKCIELNPEASATTHNMLAVAYAKTGQHSLAIKEFDAALEIKPGHANAKIGKAKIYLEQGKLDNVKEYLKGFSSEEKVPPAVDVILAEVMILENHFDLAVSHYQAALLKHPDLAEKNPELQQVEVIEGDNKATALSYRKAFEALAFI